MMLVWSNQEHIDVCVGQFENQTTGVFSLWLVGLLWEYTNKGRKITARASFHLLWQSCQISTPGPVRQAKQKKGKRTRDGCLQATGNIQQSRSPVHHVRRAPPEDRAPPPPDPEHVCRGPSPRRLPASDGATWLCGTLLATGPVAPTGSGRRDAKGRGINAPLEKNSGEIPVARSTPLPRSRSVGGRTKPPDSLVPRPSAPRPSSILLLACGCGQPL